MKGRLAREWQEEALRDGRLPQQRHRHEKQAETAKKNKRFHTCWVFLSPGKSIIRCRSKISELVEAIWPLYVDRDRPAVAHECTIFTFLFQSRVVSDTWV